MEKSNYASYNHILLTPFRKRQLIAEFCDFFENFFGRQPDINNRQGDCFMWLSFFTGYIQKIKDDYNQIETWERI